MSDQNSPPPDRKREIDRKCVEAAVEAAATPVLANRFELLPSPLGTSDQFVLVVGTSIAGEAGDESGTYLSFLTVRMHGAYMFNRGAAADLVVRLPKFLNLSEDEIKAAQERLGVHV